MSLCQSKNSSCGACCGLFNLDYPQFEIIKILEDRTQYFTENVEFSKRETIISYREEFEKKENLYPKKDSTIYNCPFLGYIESEPKRRIGCMIHPARTRDPKSQNFSFYGASICQTYDCKNKERKSALNWENFLDTLNLDEYQYSNLVGDHILFTRIEDYFIESKITIESMFLNYKELLKNILFHKMNKQNSYSTSFVIDMDSNLDISKFQKLVDKLELTPKEELYIKLKKIND